MCVRAHFRFRDNGEKVRSPTRRRAGRLVAASRLDPVRAAFRRKSAAAAAAAARQSRAGDIHRVRRRGSTAKTSSSSSSFPTTVADAVIVRKSSSPSGLDRAAAADLAAMWARAVPGGGDHRAIDALAAAQTGTCAWAGPATRCCAAIGGGGDDVGDDV